MIPDTDPVRAATAARLEATIELAADALAEFAVFNSDLAGMDPADPDAIAAVAAAYVGCRPDELPIRDPDVDALERGPNLIKRRDGRCVLVFAAARILPTPPELRALAERRELAKASLHRLSLPGDLRS